MSSFRWSVLTGLALAISALAFAAETSATIPDAPASLRWETEFTSGILWKVGDSATPLPYVLLPQILSFKIPPISERPWAGGTFVFRSRFSLLLEPIVRGPENYYLGAAAAGEIEWRSQHERFTGFFSSGGGVGWMDSKGYEVPGGQGQDFNLNWLIHAGVRFRTAHDWRLSLGLYFQHLSNRGMDKINPGLNALGPTLGLSRKF